MKRLIWALSFLSIGLAVAHAYYDSETGEFLTRDPAGFVDGPNVYTYVVDNPWTHFDPEGLSEDVGDGVHAYRDSDGHTHIIHYGKSEELGTPTLTAMAEVFVNNADNKSMQRLDSTLKGMDSFEKSIVVNDNAKAINDPEGRSQAATLVIAGATEMGGKAGGSPSTQFPEIAESINVGNKTAEVTPVSSARSIKAQVDSEVTTITVDSSKHPESAQHIQEAQASGQPSILTIDRLGATSNRKAALQGQARTPGKDRDEYPPAMFSEGGQGASVKPIDRSDNRGAGATIMHQTKDMPNGTQVQVKVKDDNK